MNFLNKIFKNKNNEKKELNKYKKEKTLILNNYLKSLIRYEDKLNNIYNFKSLFFCQIYINQNLFNLLIRINEVNIIIYDNENKIEENEKIIKNIILQSIINNDLNYDDFETLFLKYFKLNENDYNKIKEFVKPYYKEKIKDKNILKIILYIFLFHITYIQFYMIIHEFLEITNEVNEYFIYLFIYQNDKQNKEKMRLVKKELKYEYFDFYINKLFKIFYLTIHLLKDITNIIYDFDIHDIFLLKKEFLKKILLKK